MQTDKELGAAVSDILTTLGIETPRGTPADRTLQVENKFSEVLELLGLDLSDDSVKGTPKRLAKMFIEELFCGMDYDNFPACTTVENKMGYREMVVRDGIDVKSMCEHHFLPIVGKATIAYLPSTKVLGLSKMDRIVDFFSRRPQVQERLTEQLAATMKYILGTENVAVVIRAQHFCVSHRGVNGSCSDTITSRLYGKFFEVPELRAEFLRLSKA